ncbi:hypothetical protein HPB52_024048 [Rhipicephalus sanguineus]|uniref:CWF21 domain-containing protein n=1 Tax=Rhipicephalus sanguineus TaxID=34632 RepID=A0A9D4PYB5_RHISA|nr:hypothetical protein HPB52_024048 [Rhipicephalus sanguineus]
MYNGIGLQTARGSGTNGYVQRNLSLVQRSRDKVSYKSEEDIQRLDAQLIRKANSEILDHERKRKLEIKCLELQETMEEQGYEEDEISAKVDELRELLQQQGHLLDFPAPRDEAGRSM